MHHNWKKTLQLCPQYRDFDNWPDIKVNSLPAKERKAFNRNRNIVISVLKGMTITAACKKYGLHRTYGTYLLNRCLKSKDDKSPALTVGLRPFHRVVEESRNIPLSRAEDSGPRGSIDKIFNNNPNIKKRLDTPILDFVCGKKGAEILTPGAFHRRFLFELENINWPNTCYPFDRARQGYFACTNYFHRRIAEFKLVKQRERPPLLALQNTKRIYEELEIDEQLMDTPTSVDLYLDDHLVPLRLSRISAAIAIDVASDAILGYQLCLTQHPSHEDILALLEKLRRKWKPMKLTTNGVKFSPGAMFPSAMNELVCNLQPATIKLDNALSHHANRITNHVCDQWGVTVNYGHPASPKDRNFVEYAFRRLNRLSHRFESTSGSNVVDPKRESKKNNKTPPAVKLHEFEQMLEVVLTAHNIRPQARLGGSSPLEVIKHQLEHFPMAINYSELDREPCAFRDEKKVNVKSLKNERRAPFINFEGLRYTGAGLSNSKLIDRKITVRFDIRDIRRLEAFDLDGKYLGELLAPRSRQNFPLSIRTLKRINKKARQSSGMEQKTVDRYFATLLEGVKSSKNNVELIRVYREIQSSDQVILPNNELPTSSNDDSKHKQFTKSKPLSWRQQFLKGGNS